MNDSKNLNRISDYMKEQEKEFADIFFTEYHKCKTFREKKEFHQRFQKEWKQLEDFLYSQICTKPNKSITHISPPKGETNIQLLTKEEHHAKEFNKKSNPKQ